MTTDRCDPVGIPEIAERLGVVRGTVDIWRQRHDSFPAPTWTVGGRPCWRWADIARWARQTGRIRAGTALCNFETTDRSNQ